MDIKLIAVDMDGTLLGGDHLHVPERNVAALRAASALGVKIVIASGRYVDIIEEAAAQLGVLDYAVTSNGAGVIDWKSRTLLEHTGLPSPWWEELLDLLHDYGLAVETYANGSAYVTMADLEGAAKLGFDQRFVDEYVKRVKIVEDVKKAVAGKTVEKFHVFYVPPQQRESLLAQLNAAGPLVISNAEPSNLEITAPGADKGEALARLCASLGIDAQSVMAFGDGGNDVGMLSWAGWSFAMENGLPSAKEAAKYRAASNVEDGVAQAIEQYLLQKDGTPF